MEPMAIETIASKWLKYCKNYQTSETRLPIKVKNINESYSDIDFFGWKVSKKEEAAKYSVCFGEVKLREGPYRVYVFKKNDKCHDFFSYLRSRWVNLYDNVPFFFDGELNFRLHNYLGFQPNEIREINIAFVGNVWFDKNEYPDIEKNFASEFYKEFGDDLPISKDKITATIRPSISVILELIKYVQEDINNDKYSKRYGDLLFDIIREINRYQNPKPADGGRCGEDIKKFADESLKKVIFSSH